MKEINFRRHGDVNLHEITEKEFNAIQGKILEHNGSWILARGEATGSKHVLTVERPQMLVIKQDILGRMYFALNGIGTITHTHDHEIITTPKKVFYVQVQEREVDHFSKSIVRKVVD